MVALLRELVAKGEPIFLNEIPESLQRAVVGVHQQLGNRDHLEGEREEGIAAFH